jgi:hypothetical protein
LLLLERRPPLRKNLTHPMSLVKLLPSLQLQPHLCPVAGVCGCKVLLRARVKLVGGLAILLEVRDYGLLLDLEGANLLSFDREVLIADMAQPRDDTNRWSCARRGCWLRDPIRGGL